MSVKVFVYGTLRTGDCRADLPSFLKVLAPKAWIPGYLMLDIGGFPGLIPDPNFDPAVEPRLRGEVHEFENLNILDGIEGYDHEAPKEGLYNRVQVTAYTPDADIEDCWVYTFNDERNRGLEVYDLIESGDWFVHKGLYRREATA